MTNKPMLSVEREADKTLYADLKRLNVHGQPDRKSESGLWLKTWKESQPGKTITHHSRASGLWNKINARCLPGGKYQMTGPSYIGVTNGFSGFQEFAEWCNQQPGYRAKDSLGMFFEIDKDIISLGNKVYSPEYCCFVPRRINSLFTSCRAARGDLPLGVSFMSKRGKYRAYCNSDGRLKHLGHFDGPGEAHRAWQAEKVLVIQQAESSYMAEEGSSNRVGIALAARAKLILDDAINYRITKDI